MTDRVDPKDVHDFDAAYTPATQALELCRVLLVDNGDVSRFQRAADLMRAGAIVDFADDSGSALESIDRSMMDREPYELVILDLEAFGAKGYDVAESLRETQFLGPILALTDQPQAASGDSGGVGGRAAEAGCDQLLTKPVAGCVLLDAAGLLVIKDRERRYALAKPDEVTSELANYPELMMMLRRFVSQLPETVESVLSAQRARDIEQLRAELDLIKRHATSHGYTEIRASAVQARQELDQARKPDADEVMHAIDELVDVCQRATCSRSAPPPPPSGGPPLPPSG